MKILLLLFCVSCMSLPEQIADRVYSTEPNRNCYAISLKISKALRSCNFKAVTLCQDNSHAWVEFTDDKKRYILDASKLQGCLLMLKDDYRQYYKSTVRIQKTYNNNQY